MILPSEQPPVIDSGGCFLSGCRMLLTEERADALQKLARLARRSARGLQIQDVADLIPDLFPQHKRGHCFHGVNGTVLRIRQKHLSRFLRAGMKKKRRQRALHFLRHRLGFGLRNRLDALGGIRLPDRHIGPLNQLGLLVRRRVPVKTFAERLGGSPGSKCLCRSPRKRHHQGGADGRSLQRFHQILLCAGVCA